MFHLNPWYLITVIGTPEMWLGIAMVAIAVLISVHLKGWKPVRNFSLVFVVSLFLVFGMVQVTKDITMVERICDPANPYCHDSYSFPSGHSASAFAGFTALVLFLPRKWLLLFLIPVLVALSRLMLGVHTPTEVIAGSAIGLLVPLVVWKVLKSHKKI